MGSQGPGHLPPESRTLVVASYSLFLPVEWYGKDIINRLQALVPAEQSAVPATQNNPDFFHSPVFQTVNKLLYHSLFEVKEHGRSLLDMQMPVEKAVSRIFFRKGVFGEGQFISTKCTEQMLSPI